jgi:hypothetical protein
VVRQADQRQLKKKWRTMSIAQPTVNADPMNSRVTVTDVDMPFGSMVRFIFKWTLASIPTMVILGGLAFFMAMAAGAAAGTWRARQDAAAVESVNNARAIREASDPAALRPRGAIARCDNGTYVIAPADPSDICRGTRNIAVWFTNK